MCKGVEMGDSVSSTRRVNREARRGGRGVESGAEGLLSTAIAEPRAAESVIRAGTCLWLGWLASLVTDQLGETGFRN